MHLVVTTLLFQMTQTFSGQLAQFISHAGQQEGSHYEYNFLNQNLGKKLL